MLEQERRNKLNENLYKTCGLKAENMSDEDLVTLVQCKTMMYNCNIAKDTSRIRAIAEFWNTLGLITLALSVLLVIITLVNIL